MKTVDEWREATTHLTNWKKRHSCYCHLEEDLPPCVACALNKIAIDAVAIALAVVEWQEWYGPGTGPTAGPGVKATYTRGLLTRGRS